MPKKNSLVILLDTSRVKRATVHKTIFIRNNLSFEKFKKKEHGYILAERINHHGFEGELYIRVYSDDLNDILHIHTDELSIDGDKDNLSVTLTYLEKQVPYKKTISYDCVTCLIKIKSGAIKYDNVRYLKPTPRQKKPVSTAGASGKLPSKKSSRVPKYISRSAQHPLSGGGFKPK